MDGADCMTTQARGLCLDCMDGADCRKAPRCPGELDGGAHSSKLHSSSSEQTTVLYLKVGPSKNGCAQPPPNRAQPNTVTVIIYIFRCVKYSRPTPAQPLRPTPCAQPPPEANFEVQHTSNMTLNLFCTQSGLKIGLRGSFWVQPVLQGEPRRSRGVSGPSFGGLG